MSRSTFPAICLLLGLAASAHADVLEVFPGGSIQDAVDTATPGDVVLIAPGNYNTQSVTVLGKGIALVADGGPVNTGALVVRELPAGQTFLAQGLFSNSSDLFVAYKPGLSARNNMGSLRFDHCSFVGDAGNTGDITGQPPKNGTPAALVVNSVDVSFNGCSFSGGSGASLIEEDFQLIITDGAPGLEVTNSTAVLFDCEASGGGGGSAFDTVGDAGGQGGDGVLNREGGRVEIHGSQLNGGNGGSADCEFFSGFCGAGGWGGNGVGQVDAGSEVVLRGNSYSPGVGGFAGDGSGPSPSGQDVYVGGGSSTTYAAPHRGLSASSPVREGGTLSLGFSGQPGDAILLFSALSGGHAPLPIRQGVFLLGSPLVLSGVFIGVIPASGRVSAPITIGELGAGVEGFAFQLQAAYAAGGLTLLAPNPTTVLLDGAL